MTNSNIILGISAFYHDSSASLIKDDVILSACQEERITRKKFDNNFPINSIKFCLESSSLNEENIDYIVFYEDPKIKFDRIFNTLSYFKPFNIFSNYRTIKNWIQSKYNIEYYIREYLPKFKGKIFYSKHHFSHACSSFFTSPFKKSAILTIDGVGEWSCTTIGIGNLNKVNILNEQKFPNSVGILYSAFTSYLGFKVLSGEYKVMGLAPYGSPKFVEIIKKNIVNINNNGSITLNKKYFNFLDDDRIFNEKFDNLFNNNFRGKSVPINESHCDIAHSLQIVVEEIILKMSAYACKITNSNNLCLAGGVALNCVANSKILALKEVKNLWIQPAAGDAGSSLGAALGLLYNNLNFNRNNIKEDIQQFSYLGHYFSNKDIRVYLQSYGFVSKLYDHKDIFKKISHYLQNDKVIGLFEGKMEFGPRALGNRSIIADPRSVNMQSRMNLKIKFRESFRPFAPVILREHVKEWFDFDRDSPYMLFVANIRNNKKIKLSDEQKKISGVEKLKISRSKVPAITHVDYSARLQTVEKKSNFFLHSILQQFYLDTNCPIIINTSFNIRSEPIVCTPFDALKCFMNTNMDILVIGDYILEKIKQPEILKDKNFLTSFEID
jgi:carbamoyltransferase